MKNNDLGDDMNSSFLEIIELEDGGFALKRIDDDGEPLVVIDFSAEVIEFLGEHHAAVAKAMIGAGVQAAGAVTKAVMEADEKQAEERILH
ncbi:MAG: hypothetical protein ACJAWS_002811 [Oleiphilaceae bacterium]